MSDSHSEERGGIPNRTADTDRSLLFSISVQAEPRHNSRLLLPSDRNHDDIADRKKLFRRDLIVQLRQTRHINNDSCELLRNGHRFQM